MSLETVVLGIMNVAVDKIDPTSNIGKWITQEINTLLPGVRAASSDSVCTWIVDGMNFNIEGIMMISSKRTFLVARFIPPILLVPHRLALTKIGNPFSSKKNNTSPGIG